MKDIFIPQIKAHTLGTLEEAVNWINEQFIEHPFYSKYYLKYIKDDLYLVTFQYSEKSRNI